MAEANIACVCVRVEGVAQHDSLEKKPAAERVPRILSLPDRLAKNDHYPNHLPKLNPDHIFAVRYCTLIYILLGNHFLALDCFH